MSDFYIDIIDRPIFYLSIDTTVGMFNNSIEIEKYNDYNLEIINTEKVLPSDLPELSQYYDISTDQLVGNLSIQRIDFGNAYGVGFVGLDQYLDSYDFDCGTP